MVGSTGMLGRTVKAFLDKCTNFSVYNLDRADVDLATCSFDQLAEATLKYAPYHTIINCAGVIKQRAHVRPSEMIHVNSVIPHWLSRLCHINNMKLIHITTDCVFSGKTNRPYNEFHQHDAVDLYGQSKSLGEPDNCAVIRSSIIGEEEKNKLSLLEWVRSQNGQSVQGYMNHTWNGITCLQMAKIIKNTIVNDMWWTGVRHVYGSKMSKHHLVTVIRDVYGLDIHVEPTFTNEAVNRVLSTVSTLKTSVPSIDNQLQEQRYFWEHGWVKK